MTRRWRGLLAVSLSAAIGLVAVELATTPGSAAALGQQQDTGEPAQERPPEPIPDLRIVRIEVAPSPLRHGNPGTVTIMLHNRSSVVITGNIAVELTHDRDTPQPLPPHLELYYLDPDELAQVTFELPAVTVEMSPYTFFATVDRYGEISEEDEVNNTTWERVAVCESAEAEEVADGVDNDCDGMTDEGLELSSEPGAALRMLRALQRQAALDSVPLIYTTPRLFAPQPVQHEARLESEEGDFVGLLERDGAEPSAVFSKDDPNAQLALVDWDGGRLESGDLVSLRVREEYLIAEGGGAGGFITRPRFRERERLFSIIRIGAPSGGPAPGAVSSVAPIRSGDVVSFAGSTGHFLSADQGGGGRLLVDRDSAAGWESFTITLREGEQKP